MYCAPAPLHLTTAAIYAGRALSFAALIVAGQLGVPQVSCGQQHCTPLRCGTKGVLFACFAAAPPTDSLPPVPGCCPPTPPHPVITPRPPAQGVIGDISVGYTLVPLDKVDLSLVSVLYTQVGGGWCEAR